jgi:hypothetical protein
MSSDAVGAALNLHCECRAMNAIVSHRCSGFLRITQSLAGV